MSFDNSASRQLEAVVNAKGSIISWKCSACNWTKLAENPEGISNTTKHIFENHQCEEHPKKKTAHHCSIRLHWGSAAAFCFA